MLKHILALMWNRKKENALIMIELAISFLVLFFLAAFSAHNWKLYNQPLGFEYEETLEMLINTGGEWTEEDGQTLWQVVDTLRQMPDVEWAHPTALGPFRNWSWSTTFTHGDNQTSSNANQMPDGLPQDLGMELVSGRWFGEQDEGQNYDVALINQRLKDILFGDEDPLGQNLRNPNGPDGSPNPDGRELRVVGVIKDFRQHGELSRLPKYTIQRLSRNDPESDAQVILIKVRPGTPVSAEEDLINRAQAVARTWTLSVNPLKRIRAARITEVTTPLTIGALIAGFLLLMVAFGLFGVLWQNVTRRTNELGLRRAAGATRQRIFTQITLEIVVTTLIGLTLGILIAIQFPMLGTFEALNWSATLSGVLISGILVLLLATACAMYPSWLATQRSPSDALHYE